MSKVTMKDIARAAGCAQQTVSKIINKKDDHMVSSATRDKVLKLIRQMEYHPNYLASSLRSGKRHCIGLAGCGRFHQLSDPSLARISAGIGSVVDEHNNYITLIPMGDKEFSRNLQKVVASRMVDGLIMVVYSNQYDDFKDTILPALKQGGMPFVTIQSSERQLECPNVGLNIQQNGYLAAQHLVSRGFTDIGIICDIRRYTHRQLYNGYVQALQAAGIKTVQDPLAGEQYYHAEGRWIAGKIIDRKDLKQAYVVYSDAVAMGMISYFREKGMRVPQDVALAGTDDILVPDFFNSDLTSVSRKFEERGAKAAEMLFEAIDRNGEMEPKSWIAEPELITRSSSLRSRTDNRGPKTEDR